LLNTSNLSGVIISEGKKEVSATTILRRQGHQTPCREVQNESSHPEATADRLLTFPEASHFNSGVITLTASTKKSLEQQSQSKMKVGTDDEAGSRNQETAKMSINTLKFSVSLKLLMLHYCIEAVQSQSHSPKQLKQRAVLFEAVGELNFEMPTEVVSSCSSRHDSENSRRNSRARMTSSRRRLVFQPTVPKFDGPIHSRDRAVKRREFEMGRKAREDAREQAREMARRQREKEDDEYYRELRRKAVPIAHSVPDWYASAPKKKRKVSR
jgi:Targeting protein for Xklp2 (TPX2) domain